MSLYLRNKTNNLPHFTKLSSSDLKQSKRQNKPYSLIKSTSVSPRLIKHKTSKHIDDNDQAMNKTYNMLFINKPQSTFREKFLFDIAKLQQSTSRIISKLKHNQSQKSLSSSQIYSKLNHIKSKVSSNHLLAQSHYSHFPSPEKASLELKGHQSHRHRIFHLTEREVFRKYQSVYFMPLSLMKAQSKIKDAKLQLLAISDQLKLIEANIQQLRVETLYSTNFMKAFRILHKEEKRKYNILLEETSALLIIIQPKILQKIFTNLDQVLYCKLPSLCEEAAKPVSTEDECLKMNLKWFNETTSYFNACVEVFEIIKENSHLIEFKHKQFFVLKVYLDLLRYNSSTLMLSAKSYMEKYAFDEQMLNQFEEGCELRERREKAKKSLNAQYEERLKHSLVNNTNAKINKICAALDLDKKINTKELLTKRSHSNQADVAKQESLLNMPLISEIMKYYDKPTRDRITAHRLYERYNNIDYSTFT